ncbi:MAG: hypothetical protein ACRDRT_07895, partial [Pseudonocardiaceae bacterium]
SLTWLCSNYDDLCVLVNMAGLGAGLDALLARAQHGSDITEPLRKLLRDADGPEPVIRGTALPGVSSRSVGETYGCPGGRCDVKFHRPPGVAIPQCAVDDQNLLVKFR